LWRLQAAAASEGVGFAAFLADHADDLLAIIDADAGLFTIGQDRFALAPGASQTLVAADMVIEVARPHGPRFATDDLRGLGAAPTADIASACVVELTGERGRLMLFRRETPLEETWAGDPDKRVTPLLGARLNPRKSFDQFRATRRGRCRPWRGADVKAAALTAAPA